MKWPNFVEEFLEEGDRAAVIYSSSLLDDLLARLLKAFLIDKKASEELLFGGHAPLSTFSSRIKSCFCLGLILEEEYLDLNKIRKIRNEFAHNWDDINLNDSKLSQICKSMFYIRTDIELKNQVPRQCYNTAIGVLFPRLVHRAMKVEARAELNERDIF